MTSGGPTEQAAARQAVAEAIYNACPADIVGRNAERMAEAAILALQLAEERATIPIPVEEDEMDDRHVVPRRKWHMDWQQFTRLATSWRNSAGETLDEARESGRRVSVEQADR